MEYNVLKNVSLICAVIFLSACSSAKGPLYSEYIDQIIANQTYDSTLPTLTVFRPDLGNSYVGQDVSLTLNGSELGICAHNGFNVFQLPPGQHTLTIDVLGSPGSCTIPLTLESSKTYYYQISPRQSHRDAALWLGVIGQALESSGTTCGGAFSIFEVNSKHAINELKILRLSN